MTDISDLLAQQQALAVQIAVAVKPQVEDALAKLSTSAVGTLRTNLAGIADTLPAGLAKDQIGNVVIVLSNVPGILDREIEALDAQIAAATEPAPVEGE
jgi:hypothetical protein